MSHACRDCRWTDCPTLGSDQQACENWTSDPNGEVPSIPNPFAAMEARIGELAGDLAGVEARMQAMEDTLSRMVTSMITALADVD